MPVGSTLMALRRERGKTLADVQAATKIMGRMLSALENERWDELPAPVYVKGYIQNYAFYLGVDAGPLVAEYMADTGPKVEHVPLRRIPERTVVPHRLDVHAIPRQAWILVAVAVLVVALAVWGITALLGRDDNPPPIAPETTATTDGGSAVTTETPSGTTAEAPDGAFILAIDVAEGQSSWLQVRVDGLIAYEGTLPGGETKQWTVTESAVVRVGKPAAVAVRRDGQAVEIPPATDGIAELTLSTGTE